jgi:L-ascorbate metabolism protein UlaG (beta-lactamase superfamily)
MILIDPFRNPSDGGCDWFLREFPRVEADVVLVSHPHFDHDALDRVLGSPEVLRKSDTFAGDDFMIEAVPGKHAREFGRLFNHLNLIFIIRVAGINFCHLGDNSTSIPVSVQRKIGKVDVLFISIDDSHHLLTYEEVDVAIESINPKIVIPMHYLIPGLTSPNSTLRTPDTWIKNQKRVTRIKSEEVKISKDALPDLREVWFLERYACK